MKQLVVVFSLVGAWTVACDTTYQSSNCDNGKCANISAVPLAMTCGT